MHSMTKQINGRNVGRRILGADAPASPNRPLLMMELCHVYPLGYYQIATKWKDSTIMGERMDHEILEGQYSS